MGKGVRVAVPVGVAVGVEVGARVGVKVGVGVGVGVWVGVGVGVSVWVGVGVGVSVGVGVAVGMPPNGVGVVVGDGVGVIVQVGVKVGRKVGVGGICTTDVGAGGRLNQWAYNNQPVVPYRTRLMQSSKIRITDHCCSGRSSRFSTKDSMRFKHHPLHRRRFLAP